MHTKKILLVGLLALFVSQCGALKNSSTSAAADATVSYARDLAPLMQKNCAPCHFPDKGKADMLNDYDKVRRHIKGILYRVQLDPSKADYMPFKQKKAGWTADEIALFQLWQAEGFAP